MDEKRVLVEGFELQKLVNRCLKAEILLRRIKMKGDLAMEVSVKSENWTAFQKIAGSKYRLTVLEERGLRFRWNQISRRKSTLVGICLFFLILLYQNAFVSQIQINGYEHLSEEELRQSLKAAGLYEGCRKPEDLDKIEVALYREFEEISWVGIKYHGSMASVDLSERHIEEEAVKSDEPAHIVAKESAYVEKVIPREGLAQVEKGSYAEKGEILISGIVPLADTTYGNGEEEVQTSRFVHAEGEVYGKQNHRFLFYLDAWNLKRTETGFWIPGISLQCDGFAFDTTKLFWPFDSGIRKETELIRLKTPFKLKLSFISVKEVTLQKVKKSEAEIKQEALTALRKEMKENVAEKAQILNKSLSFSPGENIIEVAAMVEVLEEIGETKTFIPEKEKSQKEAEEEGI